MTLGTRSELNEQIKQVEAYGYKRSYFPITWNGHHIVLLHNDVHETDDGRIYFHLNLYCKNCHREEGIRGTVKPSHEIHVQTIKLIPLGRYFLNGCN
ncbi:hypothetical protein M199_gp269 [Halogranum tailed virus 1]|uniref:Uncharacterized protein n=1 Tax=Halogranum tailed virus 1 TaxID=1273749 RepID=R4TL63_9CAUD|nr:hypothetical protein M199_gp269 [Halogranum tailed virus 1]AGM11397.1 hypothetical protein HGTV1_78 [Halogranum tailed virus 1]